MGIRTHATTHPRGKRRRGSFTTEYRSSRASRRGVIGARLLVGGAQAQPRVVRALFNCCDADGNRQNGIKIPSGFCPTRGANNFHGPRLTGVGGGILSGPRTDARQAESSRKGRTRRKQTTGGRDGSDTDNDVCTRLWRSAAPGRELAVHRICVSAVRLCRIHRGSRV